MLLCISLEPNLLNWEHVLDELDALSPLVDGQQPGFAYVEMRGIAGSVQAWMERARALLRPFEVPVRLGAGPNKFCARAAAYIGDGTFCEIGGGRALVAPLPLELLGIERNAIERLRLLGIGSLGDLARLPHGPFVRRFGPEAACWHDWARGIDRTPFVPRAHAVAIEASVFGEGRTQDEAQVLFALRMLLARIGTDLERCGKRAGALKVEIELENGETRGFEIALAAATASERAMFDVVRAKLEGATFPAAIVGLSVQALRLEEGGEAVPLFAADDLDPQTVAVALARLEAALGEPVVRARTVPAHALERRFVYDRFEPPKREMFETPKLPVQTELVPQLRLMEVREIAVEIRGGEPAFVNLCHPERSRGSAVRECAGPWRIEEGWVSDAIVRDEYDVLLESGALYRIYRLGAHWYLRGAYD